MAAPPAAAVSLISPLHEVCSSIAHDHVVQSNVLSFPPLLLLLRGSHIPGEAISIAYLENIPL